MPSEPAMRAALAVLDDLGVPDWHQKQIAERIDRETNLPGLIVVIQRILAEGEAARIKAEMMNGFPEKRTSQLESMAHQALADAGVKP